MYVEIVSIYFKNVIFFFCSFLKKNNYILVKKVKIYVYCIKLFEYVDVYIYVII